MQQRAQALCLCSCRYQDHGFEAASVVALEGLDTGHVSLPGLLLMALYSLNRSVDLGAGTQIPPGCVAGGLCRVCEANQAQQLPAKAALAGCDAQAQQCTGRQYICAHRRSCARAPGRQCSQPFRHRLTSICAVKQTVPSVLLPGLCHHRVHAAGGCPCGRAQDFRNQH